MKSIVIMTVGENSIGSKKLFVNETKAHWQCVEAKNIIDAYRLSLICNLDIVIINRGFEDIEEENLITFLNQRNFLTVLIPFSNNIENTIKKITKNKQSKHNIDSAMS